VTRRNDAEVELLQALADTNRLAIVRQLARDGEAGAGDFNACCEVAQPTISHHLKILRQARVVDSHRRGTSIRYRLTPDFPSRLGDLLGSLAIAD
jgi:ArsR family transcriptional regulator